jgi:murein DD-endopeptidase MepM/ murein hydrolase activator NlpD
MGVYKGVSMKFIYKYDKLIIITLTVTLGLLLSMTNVLNQLLPEPTIGYEFKVDGEVWFVLESKEEIHRMLQVYKNKYLSNVDDNAQVRSIEFEQDIEITEIELEDEVFISVKEAEAMINENEEEAFYYNVVSGDSFWMIAEESDIPLSKLIELNPDMNPERIWPGNKIMFTPADPKLDITVRFQNTLVEPVEFGTEYIQDSSLYASQRVTVKNGVEGEMRVTYDITMKNGYATEVEVLNEEVLLEPVTRVVRVGTKRTLTRSSRTNFGVVSGRLTSGFGYRKDPISGARKFHNALDIAAPRGTPVYAYTNGKVVTAGWGNMTGNYVVIDHGGGLRTKYLHLSSISVSAGQTVKVGQKIGGVGSTGYSTGNHLHFEVTKNGVAVNPLLYL